MEAEQATPPTRVCRHCATQAQTAADTCPHCGRPYRRRTLANVLIGVAFGAFVGLVVYLVLGTGGGGHKGMSQRPRRVHGITFQQGATLRGGTSRSEVIRRFGPPQATRVKPQRKRGSCVYYAITDRRGVWEFCFKRDKLVLAATLPHL